MHRFPLVMAFLPVLAICIFATPIAAKEKLTPIPCSIVDVEVDDQIIIKTGTREYFEGTVLFKGVKKIRLLCEVKYGMFEREFEIEDILSVQKYVEAAEIVRERLDELKKSNIELIEDLFSMCVEAGDYRRARKTAIAGRDNIAETLNRHDASAMCDFADWCRWHYLFKDARALYTAILTADPGNARASEGLSRVDGEELRYKEILLVQDAPTRLKRDIETCIGLEKLTEQTYRDACRTIERFLDDNSRAIKAFEGYTFELFEDYCVLDVSPPEILWAESTDTQKLQMLIKYGISYAALPSAERVAIQGEIVGREEACRADIETVRCPYGCVMGRLEERVTCYVCNGVPPRELECPTCHGKGEWTEKCGYCRGTGEKVCKKCGGKGFRYVGGSSEEHKVPCGKCRGGMVDCPKCKGWGATKWNCLTCKGSGKKIEKPCRRCGGIGTIKVYRKCDHNGVRIGKRHMTPGFHSKRVEEGSPIVADPLAGEPAPGAGNKKAVVVLGGGRSISKIAEDGSKLTLDDGSIWDVRLTDASAATEWAELDRIAVTETGSADYAHALVNITSAGTVDARPIHLPETAGRPPFPDGGMPYMRERAGHNIRHNIGCGRYIILENGSLWQVAPEDLLNTMLWKPQDSVDIDVSNKREFPYVLINLARDAEVRARLMSE